MGLDQGLGTEGRVPVNGLERCLAYHESESHSAVSDSLRPHGLHSPWNSPGQNTGVGSLSLLQGIFPTQGLNPGLPHCRQILFQLSHKGGPRILEWEAYPSPADLPNPGIKPGFPTLQADSLKLSYQGSQVYHEHSTNVSLKKGHQA